MVGAYTFGMLRLPLSRCAPSVSLSIGQEKKE